MRPAIDGVDLGPGVRAGFTRAGPNLSDVVGDDATDAGAHRRAAAAWLGAPLTLARQVHGDVVHVVAPGDAPSQGRVTADALVTTVDAGLGVLVADCVPVLLADPDARVVGAVHAGRRGLALGVVARAVEAMVGLGAAPGAVRAVVGPCVCAACYEVPADLRDEVAAVVPGTAATTSWGTPSLDLRAGVAGELRRSGVGSVEHAGGCTLTDPRWYSHRGSQQRPERPAGRFAGLVALAARTGRVGPGGPLALG